MSSMKECGALLLLSLVLVACGESPKAAGAETGAKAKQVAPPDAARATFAGGCFWCMERPFEQLDGVYEVISGYAGGTKENPTYHEVGLGGTGHAEAIQVLYDPERISYERLLEVYWRQVDPTDPGGQFVDRGSQYRTVIWVEGPEERRIAERSKAALAASGRFDAPIVTPIEDAGRVWPAEDYHQDFYLKSPARYESYRRGSGRDRFLERVWGTAPHGSGAARTPASPQTAPSARTAPDPRTAPSPQTAPATGYRRPPEAELRERLTPMQYRVTQEDGTEPAFRNEYWEEKAEGIYVDVVSGEPLYSSTHKFRSGTGWPSFWRAIDPRHVVRKTDRLLGYPRTELRSALADSHLGHVFQDGPPPTGERHCINSAALRFVPKERLEAEGYGELLSLFDDR